MSAEPEEMCCMTDNVRIERLKPLLPPSILVEELPLSQEGLKTVIRGRKEIEKILRSEDDRLVVVVGPCSIHDVIAARDYAKKLKVLIDRFSKELLIVMRVYFEKPRTTIGWKGLINDPDLNGSHNINKGLRLGRGLLTELADMGIPAAVEYLDTLTPQFLADTVSWGAIGARTTESQVHRELASGLSCPVGFKNGTDGSVQIAIDAIRAASHPHNFLSVTKQGLAAIVVTKGNPTCHVILRGGKKGTNYHKEAIEATENLLKAAKLPLKIMVDCSHGNSQKDHRNQPLVAASICEQIKNGNRTIMGVMIESHLVAGNQSYEPGKPNQILKYGMSITDACIDIDMTEQVLAQLAQAVQVSRESKK